MAGEDLGIEELILCRNIKTLYNFEPPATDDEIRASALQFVRKVSGFSKPSKANEAAFLTAVDQVAQITRTLLDSLETKRRPKPALARLSVSHKGKEDEVVECQENQPFGLCASTASP
jgi:hypothetical protein